MVHVHVCMHMYFQNTFVLVQNSLVLNSGYLTNFCCCYFRAEIMKQMKNLRKQMKKKSFQVNSEWMCSHVYLIIIWTNEQAHYSYNTRDFFLFYTQKYVDLFYWTCLYMKDSSVCKWMIHAKGILKWNVQLNFWLLYRWEAVSLGVSLMYYDWCKYSKKNDH